MNRAIRGARFYTAVNTILQKDDEEKCWSLYLSCLGNPFSEQQNESFEDFLARAKQQVQPATGNNQTTEPGMTDSEMKKQITKANQILSGFVPPK